MAKYTGITGKLKVGDVVHIGNPLLGDDYCYYRVNDIEGNKAITKFRNFNTNIYHDKTFYEYGKRESAVYNNSYTIWKDDGSKNVL